MTDSAAILEAVRRLEKRIEALAAPQPVAVKRAVAAQLCGIGVSKLDALIRAGKIRTAEDSHLVPMSEVRRYCAPKQKRERKPAVGHRARQKKHLDAQSDEAWDSVTQRVRGRATP